MKPFHAGDDAEPNGKLDSAEQKDSFDKEEEGGFGGKQQGGFDGDEQENGLDGEEWQDDFGDEQADSLDELVDDHWLSCDVITCAQSFLKNQFPQQNRLEYTNALKEGKKWKSVPEQFVQIINDNSHWICTSNRNWQSGKVEIFDNLMQTEVSTTVGRQLATMLHTLRPRTTMTKVRVQEQIGESDCGLFAIALALVNGQDPAALTFDQAAMKKHLWLCLQRKQLEPFATTKKLKFKNRVTEREVDNIY